MGYYYGIPIICFSSLDPVSSMYRIFVQILNPSGGSDGKNEITNKIANHMSHVTTKRVFGLR